MLWPTVNAKIPYQNPRLYIKGGNSQHTYWGNKKKYRLQCPLGKVMLLYSK